MKKYIRFGGMTTCPTDHEAQEGDTAILTNLIYEDGALHPIGLTPQAICQTAAGSSIVHIHHTQSFCHIIIETPNADGTYTYLWTDASNNTAPLVITTTTRATSLTTMGDTVCMASAEGTVFLVWDATAATYTTVTREHLLYDIHVTQDEQNAVDVVAHLTPSAAKTIDDPIAGAPKAAALMAAAISQEAARRGPGTMHDVTFAIAALRLADGSHVMHSNIFALMPSALTTKVTADRTLPAISAHTYMHRHTITATLRHPEHAAAIGVTAIDIFTSQPQSLMDTSRAASSTTDSDGRTTSITFAPLDRQSLMQLADDITFRHSLAIAPSQWGSPIMMPNKADGPEHPLGNLQRTAYGARIATVHNQRLTIGATATLLHSPFEIGITYRYPTLDSTSRPGADEAQLETEQTAGVRADINDTPEGTTATIVTHATTRDPTIHDVWWLSQVQYPIAGIMAYPGTDITSMEHHIKVTRGGITRYYAMSQALQPLGKKGMSVAIYMPEALPHHTQHPPYLSMLLHQARMLAYDITTHTYDTSYKLWQEESEEEYESHASKARPFWALTEEPSRLRTTEPGQPLAFASNATTTIGDGQLTSLVANTRRSADGLFGDGQYYAFTTRGVWVLRFSGGKWNAQQSITRATVANGCQAAPTTDSVAFISTQGLMLVEGTKATLLSHAISGKPLRTASLPHYADIMATIGDLPQSDYPDWYGEFIHNAKICYEPQGHRLWLLSATTPGMALVYSIRAKTWAVATMGCSVYCQDGEMWGMADDGNTTIISHLTPELRHRQPVVMCSRPLSLSERHQCKPTRCVTLRGLMGGKGSHTAIAIYASNDLYHWHLIATSQGPWMQTPAAPAMKWWRIMAIGHLLPGESIEGACIRS